MLVLTRKPEEKVIILGKNKEDEIIITILKIQGDKVSIGIEAKNDTRIYRYELLLRKEKENRKNLAREEGSKQDNSSKQGSEEIIEWEDPEKSTVETIGDM